MTDKLNTSSPLLDQLRSQAEERLSSTQNDKTKEQMARNGMDELLWKVHAWLEEVARYLNKLTPPVSHKFHFPPFLTFQDLTLEQSFVSYRRHRFEEQDLIKHVEFFYRLKAPHPLVVNLSSEEANEVETKMRVAGLTFEVLPTYDQWKHTQIVQFTIQPEIRSTIRIEPDYVRHNFGFRLSNIDHLEALYMVFSPAQIEEKMLESLIQLMLGENKEFLKRAPWLSHWAPTPAPNASTYRPPRFIG
ncbi:MAG: hypothetical protein LBG61_04490 [Burkholderiales bacterium]|jgi:hypothetical protein|nr:hypothetical protein [Burkholderiales bacterium]